MNGYKNTGMVGFNCLLVFESGSHHVVLAGLKLGIQKGIFKCQPTEVSSFTNVRSMFDWDAL